MKITRKMHLEIRLQNLFFTLLFLLAVGLLGALSAKYKVEWDWTASHQHTLSESTLKVLALLKSPLKATVYARENLQVRDPIRDLIERYQRQKKDFTLDFVNPDTQPDAVRDNGITTDGEIILSYEGRTEKVMEATETLITNALERLVTAERHQVTFIEGHGERSPKGEANHDLHLYADELKRRGLTLGSLNLAANPRIPDETDVLVLSGPRTQWLAGEVKLVEAYLEKGGNLLWLQDPGDLRGLQKLAEGLGVQFLPGTVVDASTQLLGIDDPTFALVTDYPPHVLTRGFREMTLFPTASALNLSPKAGFEPEVLLKTQKRSWTELGAIQGKVAFDAAKGEKAGPLDIGFVLTRMKPQGQGTQPSKSKPLEAQLQEQRIVIIGDGDFLSNAFVGTGGNLDFGVNLIQWLSQADNLLNIPAKTAPDRKLSLTPLASTFIALGFLLLLPTVLIGMGAIIWWKRRRR